MTVAVIVVYLLLVFSIGPLAARLAPSNSKEDFFLATRSIGPVLLLLTLFGTHMSAFTLLGSTGKAYQDWGIGTYGLMASSSAVVAPLVFLLVGVPIWRVGKRHGYVTQCQYYRRRFDSDLVGLVMFALLTLLVIPYLLIGIKGGGFIVNAVTKGAFGLADGIPGPVGALAVVAVVTGYVFIGGVRAATFANAFQTLVFIFVGMLAFVVIVDKLGAADSLLGNLRELAARVGASDKYATRLDRLGPPGVGIPQGVFLSFLLIPLSVGMFPHVNMHWLTARSVATFKPAVALYPLCILAVWLPCVLLGTFAVVAELPDIDQPDKVLPALILMVDDPLLAGVLCAGVLAAVMSSLDSQTLSLSEMFTTDVVVHYLGEDRFSESGQIWLARGFTVAVLAAAWTLSLFPVRLLFDVGVWTFAAFAALLPVSVAALYWRRATKWGVLAAALVTVVLLGYYLTSAYVPGGGLKPFTPALPPTRFPVFDPVAVLVAGSALALVAVSYLTRPPAEAVVAEFFGR